MEDELQWPSIMGPAKKKNSIMLATRDGQVPAIRYGNRH